MQIVRAGLVSSVMFGALLLTQPVHAQQQAAPGAATPTQTESAAPLTKKEQKAQRKQQKAQEKAATQNAKAQKDSANALKHQDKATDAAQKAAGQQAPPQ